MDSFTEAIYGEERIKRSESFFLQLVKLPGKNAQGLGS
jgi:hypothetical protein